MGVADAPPSCRAQAAITRYDQLKRLGDPPCCHSIPRPHTALATPAQDWHAPVLCLIEQHDRTALSSREMLWLLELPTAEAGIERG